MRQFEFTDRTFFKPPIREFHRRFSLDAILKFGFQIFVSLFQCDQRGHRESIHLRPVFYVEIFADPHVIDFGLAYVMDNGPAIGWIKIGNDIFFDLSFTEFQFNFDKSSLGVGIGNIRESLFVLLNVSVYCPSTTTKRNVKVIAEFLVVDALFHGR